MIFNLETLSPWADLHRMLSNASKLRLIVGGVVIDKGPVDVTRAEDGTVTIAEVNDAAESRDDAMARIVRPADPY